MTRRFDERAWLEFVDWCKTRDLRAVPAHPWTMAAFACWCEPRYRPEMIGKLLGGIGRVHATKSRKRPDRHPTVSRTLRMIETRAKRRIHSVELFVDEDFANADISRAKVAAHARKTKGHRRGFRSLSLTPKLVTRRKL